MLLRVKRQVDFIFYHVSAWAATCEHGTIKHFTRGWDFDSDGIAFFVALCVGAKFVLATFVDIC